MLPGVTITVLNVRTGQTRTAVSGVSGEFIFPGLQPGEYQVDAELSRRLVGVAREVRERAAADGCSPRQGAYRVALERVAQAVRLRGYV